MDNSKVLVTYEYLNKHKTKRGAWTKAQILALGLKWPMRQGWMDDLNGQYITLEQAREFESGKNVLASKTIKLITKEHLKNMTDKQIRTLYDQIVNELKKRNLM